MVPLNDLCSFLDNLLKIDKYPFDASNNGLQFQSEHPNIRKAAFAVDACGQTFTKAAEIHQDFLFVHHGISWGNGMKRISGITSKRVNILSHNGISLYGAHLPLDSHDEIGHNILLSKMIRLSEIEPFGKYHESFLGYAGILGEEQNLLDLYHAFDEKLPSSGQFRILGNTQRKLKRVGIISGSGAWPELFDEIQNRKIDCLVTGEISHEVFHPAVETNTCILQLGHYRSEIPGILSVMNIVKEKFQLNASFLDVPSGM